MPPRKGNKRRAAALRCFRCDNKRVNVGRQGNTRMIHGVKKTVAPCECPECGNEWWSYHPEALTAMKAADAAAKKKIGTIEGTVQSRAYPVANKHDIDRTER
jgi:predicted  nucleic acid-binding Zn-ribbon protein